MLDTTNARRFAALATVFAMTATPSMARAQCDAGGDALVPPDQDGLLRDSFPADQDTDVPLDSPVRLRYYGRAPTPPVLCVQQGSLTSPCLAGESSVVGDEIVWQPAASAGGSLLAPSQRYFVTYTETAAGTNRITFSTGSGVSPARLTFSGVSDVSSDPATANACDRDAADITVTFNRARSVASGLGDTAWPDIDVEYVIYQTRGPGIAGPRERDRVRLQRSGSTVVSEAQRTFRLTGMEASGPVCFNVQAIDPLGRADGNTAEACVNPAKGNYFMGCAARPADPMRSAWGVWLTALAITTARSWRRRRRCR